MKKLKGFKMLALILSIIMLCSVMPNMVYAGAGTLSLDAVKDILPGGADVGFYDNPAGGGSIRGLEASGTMGVCLRNTEWIKYDVSSLDPGTYQLSVVKSSTSMINLKVSLNDTVAFPKVALKTTGSYNLQKEIVVGSVTITEPDTILTIENVGTAAMYVNTIKLVDYETIEKRQVFLTQSRPYVMSYLPCIVQAENFDSGIKDVAYYDSDSLNTGGEYRVESEVDIFKENEMYYVNMTSNDWMAYTLSVDNPGNYDLILNLQDAMESSMMRVYMDGYEILRIVPQQLMPIGTMRETNIGTFYIKEGIHTLYIKCLDGDVNLDYIRFKKSKNDGIDIEDTSNLRAWADSQELSDEDYESEVVIVNPVEREIYVDSSAKAGGNGSKESPFATITEAKDFVKTVNKNMKGDIVVNLKGEFKIDETLNFTIEDSGSDIYSVIYRGDGDTVIHGGKKVTGWKQAEGSPLWQTTVPDMENFRNLFIGENRGVRSRSKYLYWMAGEYDDPETNYSNAEGYFIKAKDFPQGFSKPEDMEMIWMPSWKNIKMPIDSITDMGDGTWLVKYPQPYFDALHTTSTPMSTNIPYYLENAPEFLDSPGEYYFDTDTKVLTYYPFSYEDMNTIDCYIPVTEFLVKVSGDDLENKAKNITFEGINFKYGGWERTTERGFSTVQADEMNAPEVENDPYGSGLMLLPAQIQVHFADNINFKKNSFTHLGSAALSFNNGTTTCLAEGNLFDDISATAVTVGDWRIVNSDPLEKYTRKIKIKNNLIRRPSVEYMTPIITGYYVNNITVDHNDILDAPYSGISMGWGWGRNNPYSAYNRMTNNRIENVTYKLMDGGHIYTLDPMKGGLISGNYLKQAGEWKGGIYHDNASAFIRTTNNVFEDCPKWYKLTWHNIHDNVAYNNYSERPHVNQYPDTNSTEPAKGKVNGEWPEEAKAIIANSGLTDEYKYLYDEYNAKENLRNATLEKFKYQEDAGIFIAAGDYMEGGEGVAYHEILGNTNGRSVEGEPSVYESYDGTLLHYLMVTIQGEWTKYKFTVDEPGEYEIFTKLAVVGDSTSVTVEIDDREVAKELHLDPNCTGYDVFTDYSVGTIYLEPGEHIIKVEHAIGNFGFKGVRIAKVGEVFNRNDGFNNELLSVVLGK